MDEDSEDEFDVSVEDQKNQEKYLFIPQNERDCTLSNNNNIMVKDMNEFKNEEFPKQQYAWIVKLKSRCLGKSHVIYSGTGLHFNDTAMKLLKNEDNEDGLILGDIILFTPIEIISEKKT